MCPDDSREAFRAFGTLICEFFESQVETTEEGDTVLTDFTTQCVTGAGGSVLNSGVFMRTDDNGFFIELDCSIAIPVVNVVECPFDFRRLFGGEDMIRCEREDMGLETLAEAEEALQTARDDCMDSTLGLGKVMEFSVGKNTSDNTYFSEVICMVAIPRFGDFADDNVIRACDTTCTEEIGQLRGCINGDPGDPGCIGPLTRSVEQRCNTGPDRDGLCPLEIVAPAIVTPLLLDDEPD